MIRKAIYSDIPKIAQTYEDLLRFEEENGSSSNWKLGVYPTIRVPQSRVPEGTMYVLEEDGEICASMILNQEQAEEYASIKWAYPASSKQVLVIHTLCIPPKKAGHGYGRRMVDYAKRHAKKIGCTVIRIDTYAHNEPAKRLYQKNGFRIAGYATCLLEGLIEEELVFLEYREAPVDLTRFEQFRAGCESHLADTVDGILRAGSGKKPCAIGFITTDDFQGFYLSWAYTDQIETYYDWEEEDQALYPDYLYDPLVEVVDACQEIDFCNPSDEKWEFAKGLLTVLRDAIRKIPDEVFHNHHYQREDVLFFATMSDGDYVQEMLETSLEMFGTRTENE